MWNGFPMLLLLCIVMATASFLAGLLPLSLALSQRQLRSITALGTGVLVGTALIVIIPEGIETLYSSSGSSHSHGERSLARRGGVGTGTAAEVRWHTKLERDTVPDGADTESPPVSSTAFRTGPDDGFSLAEALANSDTGSSDLGHDEHSSLHTSESTPEPSHQDDGHTSRDPHAWVGISLITGFILMYLIDTLPAYATRSQPQSLQINLNQFSFTRTPSVPASEEPETPSASTFPHPGSSKASSTTLGLVIHAAADGIALGASSTSTSGKLNFIIFLALMLHKAPAAFGLTSVLLKQNLSKRSARAHLIVFSAAAPLGALLTWAVVNLLGYGGESAGTEFATGVLLLFSGGTFLYVAVHVMQESGGGHEHAAQGNGYAEVPMGLYEGQDSSTGAAVKGEEGGVVDVLVTVVGMMLPLLTQFGHAH